MNQQPIDFSRLTIDQFLLTLRIIVGSLATGLVTFGLVIHFVIDPPGNQGDDLMTKIGLAMGLAMLVGQQVAGSVVRGQAAKDLPRDEDRARGRLLAGYQTSAIVSAAMLEGAGFFNLIAYGFLDGKPVSLAMAALMVVAILSKFPLRGVVEDWLDRQLRDARESRSLGGDGR